MSDVQFFAYEDLSVTTTATGGTAATYLGADYAHVVVEGAPVRFRLDAGTPTSSVGTKLNVGDAIELQGADEVKRFKAISGDGATATLRVQYGVRR